MTHTHVSATTRFIEANGVRFAYPLAVISEWRQRDHPFVRKYVRPDDVIDASDLFKRHMQFGDSKAEPGLQMADVWAAVARRYYGDGWREPYARMVERVVLDDHGHQMLMLHLDESSLRIGQPEDAIKFIEDLRLTLNRTDE